MFSSVSAQDVKRVLFVGNSYIYTNDLPGMVASMATSEGNQLIHSSNAPGGCTFMQHCNNQSMTLIQQGGWDAVILQEQSQYPSFPQWQVETEVFPYAAQLVNAVYASSPCAEPIFYMTWGRRDGDQANAAEFPVLGTYEGMDSMLYERYMFMAEANDASVSPVGRVWRKIRREHPEIELYSHDGSHPSMAGTYAAACTFYAMIFHHDPAELTYNGNLDAETARTIRIAASEVVWSAEISMPNQQWMRPFPHSNFLVGNSYTELLVSDTVRFINLSTHSDSLLWDFGDGMTATSASNIETITHCYNDSGDYTITVVASRHCMTDTSTFDIHIEYPVADSNDNDTTIVDPVGIETVFDTDKPLFDVYPSPTTGNISIEIQTEATADLQKGDLVATILNPCGQIVSEKTIKIQSPSTFFSLSIAGYPAGIYLLRLQQGGRAEIFKIVKY